MLNPGQSVPLHAPPLPPSSTPFILKSLAAPLEDDHMEFEFGETKQQHTTTKSKAK